MASVSYERMVIDTTSWPGCKLQSLGDFLLREYERIERFEQADGFDDMQRRTIRQHRTNLNTLSYIYERQARAL